MAWMVNVATIAARYSHKHFFPSYFYLKIGCIVVTFDLHILISVVQSWCQIKGSVQLYMYEEPEHGEHVGGRGLLSLCSLLAVVCLRLIPPFEPLTCSPSEDLLRLETDCC